MKKIKNMEAFQKLNQHELSNVKGGEDDREYYYVIIDGKRIKVYV